MIEFWLFAGLLALLALAFIAVPVLRTHKVQAEEDRTSLNVTLYQERVRELEAQHEAGALDDAQLSAGKAEAARELLDDTENQETRQGSLGKAIPLVMAFLVPICGIGLYMHWGALEKVELTRDLEKQPATLEEMTALQERLVKADPDSAESWYFLGRSYMTAERMDDALNAFKRAAELSGRAPEALGMWIQAAYFKDGKWSEELQSMADEALAGNPDEMTTLGVLGLVAFEAQRYGEAADYWQRVVQNLPENDPARQQIEGRVNEARQLAQVQGHLPQGSQPQGLAEMIAQLEAAVEKNPDSAEGWYFLARSYMSADRGADAAKAFKRTAELGNRTPEVLGMWAQAEFFANGNKWTGQVKALAEEALAGNPNEISALSVSGIAAFEEKRFEDAIDYWQRVSSQLSADDPSRKMVEAGIANARRQLGQEPTAPKQPRQHEQAAAVISVEVSLADALKSQVKPDDSVFVFARAVEGPPMPLAVKRLTVADLPARVELSDGDAMMPQLRLSGFAEVQLLARVSRAGDGTKGEWVSPARAVKLPAAGVQQVVIEQADE